MLLTFTVGVGAMPVMVAVSAVMLAERLLPRTRRLVPAVALGCVALGLLILVGAVPPGLAVRQETVMPPNPAYHVVAMSMPIVYTREGDHDPNGLLFTLKAHEPLLRWARDRWEDHDEFLPRLHERRQRLQLVVDNLGLLNLIVPRLRTGSDADRELLAELVRREHVGGVPGPASDPDEDDDEDGSGRDGLPPHDRAVRQNVLRVVGDLRFALDELAGCGRSRRQACRSRTSGWSV